MHKSQYDPEVMRLTGSRERYSPEQIREHLKKVEAATDRVDYAVLANNDDLRVVGEVVLNDHSPEDNSMNYRICLFSSADFGKGYGSEATSMVLDHAFGALDLHRVELEVYAFNPRAARVYEKAGFQREGVRRDALRWEGEYVDAIGMGAINPAHLSR